MVALAVGVGTGSMTYAQAPDPSAGSGSGSASATVEGEVSVSGTTTIKLSAAEMATQLGSLQTQTREDLQHVLHLQALARKDKDVIKLNCINDKLVQMKAQMNIFDNASQSLTGSLGSAGEERHSLYVEVTLAGENIKRIRSEADVCAGEDILRQESSSSFTSPDIIDDPTTWDPEWDPSVPEVEPPIYASPYR